MSNTKLASSRVVLGFIAMTKSPVLEVSVTTAPTTVGKQGDNKALQPVPGMKPSDAAEIKDGRSILETVNKNIRGKKKPFAGIKDDDKHKLMAYVVLKRENPVLGEGDHVNFEAAAKALDSSTFSDTGVLDEMLVKQLNKMTGAVQAHLVFDKKKGVTVDDAK